MKRKIYTVFLVIFIIVFAVAAGVVIHDTIQSARESGANEKLAEGTRSARDAASGAVDDYSDAEDHSVLFRQYKLLWEQNHDMVGWLHIDDTVVDYPVVYTPDNIGKYLRRGFDGKYAVSGTLFLGSNWEPDGNYAIIYGHRMHNGTMFGQLRKYKDRDYAAAHSKICFDTLETVGEYEFVASFYSRKYGDEAENVFKYEKHDGIEDREVFEEYVRQVKKAALFDSGVDVVYGDRLLVLSTCDYYVKDGRFVVVARQRASDR